ncbi:hypothetical protein LK07_27925 [Streptomyces pluripotens]|uniref:Uncharacterized protein n=1 Tax=Streptomyces pluripotens TaxID=1355015 RepID=A0A221P4L5_9ACTN|nr:hypothetical protein LK06_026765 [Streptomyces pluripotens]ASN27223.1 hypothetical protein LK07_27925 [Streptomyces pluripotens]
MGWHQRRLNGFGLEGTGTDPRESRKATGDATRAGAGEPAGHREPLSGPQPSSAAPGMSPADAVAAHGVGSARPVAGYRPADATTDVPASRWRAGAAVVARTTTERRPCTSTAASRPTTACGIPAHAGAGAA